MRGRGKMIGGLFLIAVSVGVYLYTRQATAGQMTYVMWGPAAFGAVLLVFGWLDR